MILMKLIIGGSRLVLTFHYFNVSLDFGHDWLTRQTFTLK